MTIQEIISNGANVSITISAKDLLEVINYTVSATRKEIEQCIIEDKSEAYMSPKEVSEFLGVHVSTLWHWQKRNYLKPVEVGGKRVYLQSEIKAMLSKKSTIII